MHMHMHMYPAYENLKRTQNPILHLKIYISIFTYYTAYHSFPSRVPSLFPDHLFFLATKMKKISSTRNSKQIANIKL